MYTHPSHTRQGIGTYILSLVEGESKKLGFRKFELMATVSGILLFERKGYEVTEKIEYISKKGNKVPMYKMKKDLDD
jgi:ribosomal protein S18 acetylase RimI-like enzyme